MNKRIKLVVPIAIGVILIILYRVFIAPSNLPKNPIISNGNDPIRIGYIAGGSGSVRVEDTAKNSIEMTLEEINNSGQLKIKLELVYADVGTCSAESVNAEIIKLIKIDKVAIIFGSDLCDAIHSAIMGQLFSEDKHTKDNNVLFFDLFSSKAGPYWDLDQRNIGLITRNYQAKFQKNPVDSEDGNTFFNNGSLYLEEGYDSMHITADAIKSCEKNDYDYTCIENYIDREWTRSSSM